MAKVIGVGGVFFLCEDPDATREWYSRVLGIKFEDYGGRGFRFTEATEVFPKAAQTVWSPFKGDSDYFKPSDSDFMFNLMVDDFDDMLKQLEAAGVLLEGEPMIEPYGKFAWVMDPDGRKVELWQPIEEVPA